MNELPEHIFVKILRYLRKKKDLLNATLVCKYWNNVISETSSIMNRLPLKLSSSLSEMQALQGLNLSRKYTLMKLSNYSIDGNRMGTIKFSDKNIINLIEMHGIEIRDFVCTEISFDVPAFYHILRCLPKLESINLWCCQVVDYDIIETVGPKIVLESLEYWYSNSHFNIFRIVEAPKLKIIYGVGMDDLFKHCSLYLSNLTELNIDNCNEIAELKPTSNIPALKKLRLSEINEEIVLQILHLFKDSLNVLQIDGPSIKALDIIYTKLTNLEILEVGRFWGHNHNELQTVLKPNKKIKKLITRQSNSENMLAILGNLPNVEELSLAFNENDLMKIVACNLLRLRKLQIDKTKRKGFENVQIPTLRELLIGGVDADSGLDLIAENCSNLEIVRIRELKDKDSEMFHGFYKYPKLTDTDLVKIAQHLKQLRHVFLGRNFKPTKEAFQILLDNCPKLETVAVLNRKSSKDLEAFEFFKASGKQLKLVESEWKHFERFEIRSTWWESKLNY